MAIAKSQEACTGAKGLYIFPYNLSLSQVLANTITPKLARMSKIHQSGRSLHSYASASRASQCHFLFLRCQLRTPRRHTLADAAIAGRYLGTRKNASGAPQSICILLPKFYETHGIKLHVAKCRFFMKEVKWYRRTIFKDGVKMDSKCLFASVDKPIISNEDQLQQRVCAANWMRISIPDYNRIIDTLSELLE